MINSVASYLHFLLLFLLGLLAVVVPNSFQLATACLLLLCSLISLPSVYRNGLNCWIFGFVVVSWLVTSIYVAVGVVAGAPIQAVLQVIFIYIISPSLWIVVFSGLLHRVSMNLVVKIFLVYTALSILSIALFFFLFTKFGAEAVSVFKEDANVNVSGGYSGATMHVYGSLIFLTAAFFSASDLIQRVSIRWVLLMCLFLGAITSGRSALILAAPIGILVNFFVRSYSLKSFKDILFHLSFIFFFFFFCAWFLFYFYSIDVAHIIKLFFEEIIQGGGSARSGQTSALLEGINDNYGLGSGHGIGVDYIRSGQFPWRYEVVWLATIFRVGFIGAFLYFLPFALYAAGIFYLWLKGRIDSYDRFLFGGFLAVFVASTTNPYIEAFTFQWMYVLPVCHFFTKASRCKSLGVLD